MFATVARSAQRERVEPGPEELDELVDDALLAQHLRDRQHEVGRRHALAQRAGQPHADHPRRQHVDGLAEHHRLGLDAADAPADDAEPVDHRRVRVGPDDAVGEGDRPPVDERGRPRPAPGTRGSPGGRCPSRAARRGSGGTPSGPTSGTGSARRCAANSISTFFASASAVPNASTCTLWSITRSTGTRGLIFVGSPPSRFMASRMAARSTMQGTPVKSWRTTRDGDEGHLDGVGRLRVPAREAEHVLLGDREAVLVAQRGLEDHADRVGEAVHARDAGLRRARRGGRRPPGRPGSRGWNGRRTGSSRGSWGGSREGRWGRGWARGGGASKVRGASEGASFGRGPRRPPESEGKDRAPSRGPADRIERESHDLPRVPAPAPPRRRDPRRGPGRRAREHRRLPLRRRVGAGEQAAGRAAPRREPGGQRDRRVLLPEGPRERGRRDEGRPPPRRRRLPRDPPHEDAQRDDAGRLPGAPADRGEGDRRDRAVPALPRRGRDHEGAAGHRDRRPRLPLHGDGGRADPGRGRLPAGDGRHPAHEHRGGRALRRPDRRPRELPAAR